MPVGVLTSPKQISTLPQGFACARLSRPYLSGSSSRPFRDARDHGFWPQPLAVAWDRRPDRRTRRALLHLRCSCAAACGPAMLVTQDPKRSFRTTPVGEALRRKQSARSALLELLIDPASAMLQG